MVMHTPSRCIYCLSSYENSSILSSSAAQIHLKIAINNLKCYHNYPTQGVAPCLPLSLETCPKKRTAR